MAVIQVLGCVRHVIRLHVHAVVNIVNPGDLLSYVIRETTGQEAGNCGSCRECIDEMNRNGWWWCWSNRRLISERLVKSARQRGHYIENDKALTIIVAAFREFYRFRKEKGTKNMQAYTIRKIMRIPGVTSTKEAMTKIGEAVMISVTISLSSNPSASEFPVMETANIDAESFEDAMRRINEAETTSVQLGQQTAARVNLPPTQRPAASA